MVSTYMRNKFDKRAPLAIRQRYNKIQWLETEMRKIRNEAQIRFINHLLKVGMASVSPETFKLRLKAFLKNMLFQATGLKTGTAFGKSHDPRYT